MQIPCTYVCRSSTAGLGVLFRDLYEENGPPTEDADIMFSSTPNHMFEVRLPPLSVLRMTVTSEQILHKYATEEIAELDRPTLDGLQKVGFKIDYGQDLLMPCQANLTQYLGIGGSGFITKYFTRGGGYCKRRVRQPSGMIG